MKNAEEANDNGKTKVVAAKGLHGQTTIVVKSVNR